MDASVKTSKTKGIIWSLIFVKSILHMHYLRHSYIVAFLFQLTMLLTLFSIEQSSFSTFFSLNEITHEDILTILCLL